MNPYTGQKNVPMAQYPQEAASSLVDRQENDNLPSMTYQKESFYMYKILMWFICAGIVILVALQSANLGVSVENKNDINNISPLSTGFSGLSGSSGQLEVLKLIIQDTEENQALNGVSIRPYPVCVNECRKEFCIGLEEGDTCNYNQCHGVEGVTFEDCLNGCLCCDSYTICLKTQDEEACKASLPDCSFEPYQYPPQTSSICYGTKNTENCPWIGVGFNYPVQVDQV